MTIAAAYLTSEGVVFGADSTTTVTFADDRGGNQVAQLINHAQKVYEVGPPGASRFALATWGVGAFPNKSHRTVIAQAASQFTEDMNVRDAVDKFCDIVQPFADSHLDGEQIVGYFLGGVNPGDFSPECWQLIFYTGRCERTQLQIGEARFNGAPEFFVRVFRGFDPNLPSRLLQSLSDELAGSVKDFDKVFSRAFERAVSGLVIDGHNDLPIREAIDFIHTYLHVTIKAFKFRLGPPACGGPIEIGFVSTDRFFRWVCHKDFDSAMVEHSGGLNV